MLDLVPADTELLGGLELGGVPIATVLSAAAPASRRCSCASRPRTTAPASSRRAGRQRPPGHAGRGRDHHRRARSATPPARCVTAGATVEVVVCAIDRSPEGENPLADVGLEVSPCSPRPSSTPPAADGRTPAGAGGRGRAASTGRSRPRPPATALRRCRHHSNTSGSNENATMTIAMASMLSRRKAMLPEEVAQQGDREDPEHRARGGSRTRTARAASASRRRRR